MLSCIPCGWCYCHTLHYSIHVCFVLTSPKMWNSFFPVCVWSDDGEKWVVVCVVCGKYFHRCFIEAGQTQTRVVVWKSHEMHSDNVLLEVKDTHNSTPIKTSTHNIIIVYIVCFVGCCCCCCYYYPFSMIHDGWSHKRVHRLLASSCCDYLLVLHMYTHCVCLIYSFKK